MPAPLIVAPWETWNAGDYFEDYYGRCVDPDEQAALRFQLAFLRRSRLRDARAVEFGCGPTLMRAIAASGHVAALDMADWLDVNLTRIRLWKSADPRADDWTRFTEYILRCEGVLEPSRDQVAAREQRTRSVIASVVAADALHAHPLGPERDASYDLLVSGFCLDCLSQSQTVWRACMHNVFGLVRPGGSFVMLALRGCERYRVGECWFPGANLQRADFESGLLECGADPDRMEVTECELPTHAPQGYEGILMACGQLMA